MNKQEKAIRDKLFNTKRFKDWWSKQSILAKSNKLGRVTYKGLFKLSKKMKEVLKAIHDSLLNLECLNNK